MADMAGNVAIVAAASGGLGKAIALRLAERGADVVVCSRDERRIEAAAEEIRDATGRTVLAVAADVSRAEDITRVIERALAIRGRIDTLVTNAGGPPSGSFEDFDDAAWLSAHEINLLSVVRFVRGVLPTMKSQRSGSIVNVISTSVKQPLPGLILSNTYRSAVVGMAKTVAEEMAPYGVRVNNIAPGRIDTERVRSLDAIKAERTGVSLEEAKRQSAAAIPLGRYGEPREFANVAAFLASSEASYLTGVTLQVDGGLVRTLT